MKVLCKRRRKPCEDITLDLSAPPEEHLNRFSGEYEVTAQENWSSKLLSFIIWIIVFSVLAAIALLLYRKWLCASKSTDHVRRIRKWIKKKVITLDREKEAIKRNDEEDFSKVKALQIADGEAQIYYIIEDEQLVIQIKEVMNHGQNNLNDFCVEVILLKNGKTHKSVKGPLFSIKAENLTFYDKGFVFHLQFEDLPICSVIIQVQGKMNDKKCVASRVFIHLNNFDIIYTSNKSMQESHLQQDPDPQASTVN